MICLFFLLLDIYLHNPIKALIYNTICILCIMVHPTYINFNIDLKNDNPHIYDFNYEYIISTKNFFRVLCSPICLMYQNDVNLFHIIRTSYSFHKICLNIRKCQITQINMILQDRIFGLLIKLCFGSASLTLGIGQIKHQI